VKTWTTREHIRVTGANAMEHFDGTQALDFKASVSPLWW
jgi:hypothetical protein